MADPQKQEEVKQSFLQTAKKWGGKSLQRYALCIR